MYLWSAEMYIANIYSGDWVGVTFIVQVVAYRLLTLEEATRRWWRGAEHDLKC